jgi:hypothetical protein
MIQITKHDDGTASVALPAYVFEVSNKEGTAEALIEKILERVREELEDHFELNARFIADGSAA